MNIDLIACYGFDLDLKLLTTVTKYGTLTQTAYTWLYNNRKKNEWADGTSIQSWQYPVFCPPCSPAAEKPTLSCIHMPDMFPAQLGSGLRTVIWGRAPSPVLLTAGCMTACKWMQITSSFGKYKSINWWILCQIHGLNFELYLRQIQIFFPGMAKDGVSGVVLAWNGF